MAVPTWVDNSTPVTSANLQAMTNADATEAATNAALGGTASWQDNLNRIRGAISLIVAGNTTTGMATLLTSAVQMIPLAQKGATSGVAALDSARGVIANGGAIKGVGTTSIPSGTANAAFVNVTDTNWPGSAGRLLLLPQASNLGGVNFSQAQFNASGSTASGTFQLQVYTSTGTGSTSGAVSVAYLIFA